MAENMAIRAISPGSAIRPAFAQALRRLAGSASAALGGIQPVSRSAGRDDAGAANASVVSELVTSHAGGAVTTITTYQDGHSTARTAFARFTSSGEMDASHGGTGQLIDLLV